MLLPECSVGDPERKRLKLKHAWQLTPCLYVLLQIINGRLPMGSTNIRSRWLLKSLQVSATAATNNSADDFTYHASVAALTVSCPGCWHMWYLAISGEHFNIKISTSSWQILWQTCLLLAQARPHSLLFLISDYPRYWCQGISIHVSGGYICRSPV